MSKSAKCLHNQNWISLQYTTLGKKTLSLQSFTLMMPNTSKSWEPQRIMESADNKDWTGTSQKVYFEILVNCHICSAHCVDKGCLYNRFSSRNWVGWFTNFCSIFLLFSHQISTAAVLNYLISILDLCQYNDGTSLGYWHLTSPNTKRKDKHWQSS